MTSTFFAQALYNLAQKDDANPKQLVKKLEEYLARKNRLKLLPSILQALRKIELQQEKLTPLVEVANEQEIAKSLKEAVAIGVHTTKAKVNPSLIAGWRATENGKLYDNSAKRSLIEIYRKITT